MNIKDIKSDGSVDVEVFTVKGMMSLCLSIRGREDMNILNSKNGHTEIAISASLDEIEKLASHMLYRVNQYRQSEKEEDVTIQQG